MRKSRNSNIHNKQTVVRCISGIIALQVTIESLEKFKFIGYGGFSLRQKLNIHYWMGDAISLFIFVFQKMSLQRQYGAVFQ